MPVFYHVVRYLRLSRGSQEI